MNQKQDPHLVAVQMREREADRLDVQREPHLPEQATVTLHLTDDVVLRSST
jgi:hypothetical protein